MDEEVEADSPEADDTSDAEEGEGEEATYEREVAREGEGEGMLPPPLDMKAEWSLGARRRRPGPTPLLLVSSVLMGPCCPSPWP
jgi:hypothetical protein